MRDWWLWSIWSRGAPPLARFDRAGHWPPSHQDDPSDPQQPQNLWGSQYQNTETMESLIQPPCSWSLQSPPFFGFNAQFFGKLVKSCKIRIFLKSPVLLHVWACELLWQIESSTIPQFSWRRSPEMGHGVLLLLPPYFLLIASGGPLLKAVPSRWMPRSEPPGAKHPDVYYGG